VPIGEDLEFLENSIRQLKIEWEKFFGGVERKPPYDLKFRVDSVVRRHSNAEIRNNAERFRYMNLVARYNTFSELWAKRLRALEEGARFGLHGSQARTAGPPPVLEHLPEPPARPAPGGNEVRVQDPGSDGAAVRKLFDNFLEARKAAGEAGAVKFESFQKIINQQAARILTEKGAKAVDFRLETKDGKVSLKAKPVR
jgi:hypothetical protein